MGKPSNSGNPVTVLDVVLRDELESYKPTLYGGSYYKWMEKQRGVAS